MFIGTVIHEQIAELGEKDKKPQLGLEPLHKRVWGHVSQAVVLP